MDRELKITVTSSSFSKSENLRSELLDNFPQTKFNLEGLRLSGQKLIKFVSGAQALVVGLEPIDQALLDACPQVKFIAKYGVGLDNIDLELCQRRGVKIGWTGGVNKVSVAELTIGSMLALCRNFYVTSNELKLGRWNKSGGSQLTGKTVGIIGYGHIGQEVARLLKPFGCSLWVNDILDISNLCKNEPIKIASKEEIFKNADFITIHTPLTHKTRHLINPDTIAKMKSSVFIINTARGDIVDLGALKYALQQARIAGASIDVYPEEPPTDMDLISIPNLISTPHIGGNTSEAILAMGQNAIKHLKDHYLARST